MNNIKKINKFKIYIWYLDLKGKEKLIHINGFKYGNYVCLDSYFSYMKLVIIDRMKKLGYDLISQSTFYMYFEKIKGKI